MLIFRQHIIHCREWRKTFFESAFVDLCTRVRVLWNMVVAVRLQPVDMKSIVIEFEFFRY